MARRFVAPPAGYPSVTIGPFEREAFGDEAVAPGAIAVPHFAGIKADRTARQKHDRDAVVISDIARRLTGLAGLKRGHVARPLSRYRNNTAMAATASSSPPHTATAQQRSISPSTNHLSPDRNLREHGGRVPSLTHVNPPSLICRTQLRSHPHWFCATMREGGVPFGGV